MLESELFKGVLTKLDQLLSRYLDHSNHTVDLTRDVVFFWNGTGTYLQPIKRPVHIDLDDLIGIDEIKKKVVENTMKFVNGQKTNNVLLWGERGTGKSSLIKSLSKAFFEKHLRIIQVYKHDILTIQAIYDLVAENRNFRFIIFIDDLSFEETQTDYKELKTIMDGGLEEVPDNLLFYATSNRKHLIPTRFSDRDDDEIRPSDTMEEKISLADRFGLRLGFYHISQDTYLEIVDFYADRYDITLDKENLHQQALQWSLETGGRNGRVAEQFVMAQR